MGTIESLVWSANQLIISPYCSRNQDIAGPHIVQRVGHRGLRTLTLGPSLSSLKWFIKSWKKALRYDVETTKYDTQSVPKIPLHRLATHLTSSFPWWSGWGCGTTVTERGERVFTQDFFFTLSRTPRIFDELTYTWAIQSSIDNPW